MRGRQSTEVAFALCIKLSRVRILALLRLWSWSMDSPNVWRNLKFEEIMKLLKNDFSSKPSWNLCTSFTACNGGLATTSSSGLRTRWSKVTASGSGSWPTRSSASTTRRQRRQSELKKFGWLKLFCYNNLIWTLEWRSKLNWQFIQMPRKIKNLVES